jgi:nitroreductase
VPRADIEWIIANATRAASNGNLQPWKLHITTGQARQRLSAAILRSMDDGDHGPGREADVTRRNSLPCTTPAASWSASALHPCSACRAATAPAC